MKRGSTQRSFDSVEGQKRTEKPRQSPRKRTRPPREAESVKQSFDFERTAPPFEPQSDLLFVAGGRRLFWFCGGFDAQLLERDECASIRAKYTTVGAAVLITGAFAYCSSYYFFSTVLNEDLARVFAVLWALSIFTTDRYIISTTRKRAAMLPYCTGGEQRKLFWTSSVLLNAMPRLALGVLVSLVIATPLEVALQKSRIETAREEEINGLREGARNRIEAEVNALRPDLQSRFTSLQKELPGLETEATTATAEAIGEADGTKGTGIRNLGPIYNLKLQRQRKAEQALQSATRDLARVQEEISSIRASVTTRYENQWKARQGDHSFSAYYETLEALRIRSPAINRMSWGLTLVFLALELCPVLAKLFSSYDTYDSLLQNFEGCAQMANVAAEADERLRYEVRTKMREIWAEYLKRQMARLSETEPRPESLRVIDIRASNEFRDAASDAVKYRRQPQRSTATVRRPPRIVVLARESRDRLLAAMRRTAEYLKNSLSLIDLIGWLERKFRDWH